MSFKCDSCPATFESDPDDCPLWAWPQPPPGWMKVYGEKKVFADASAPRDHAGVPIPNRYQIIYGFRCPACSKVEAELERLG